jgi:hypothetical protein
MSDQRCGEVIAADTVHLEAECPRLYDAPNFGSFVRVDSDGLDIYAVVYHIATGCIDSNRRTQALGLTPDEIPLRMPHLDLVLRTTFAARVIGFRTDGEIYNHLPVQPARIHCFVAPVSDEEVRVLTKSPTFLRALATTPEAPVEEVTGASVRAAHAAWRREAGDGRANEQLVLWGKYLARLFRNDYDRFEAIVQRVPPMPGSGGKPWEERLPLASDDRDPFT